MIYSGHQLSFCPWLGYWKKVFASDYFDVNIYDQFTKRTWIHYTYIGNKDKLIKWKLPVEDEYIEHSTSYAIKDVKVKKNFAEDMLRQFYDVHYMDKYFEYMYPLLCEWLRSVEKLGNLWEINLILMEKIYNLLQMQTKLVCLPNFSETDDASLKIAKQAETMRCDTYLSGPHGATYLNMKPFEERNISVVFQSTSELYKLYPQSILSVLSQYGITVTLDILKNDKN